MYAQDTKHDDGQSFPFPPEDDCQSVNGHRVACLELRWLVLYGFLSSPCRHYDIAGKLICLKRSLGAQMAYFGVAFLFFFFFIFSIDMKRGVARCSRPISIVWLKPMLRD
jgi:hypothetical protein